MGIEAARIILTSYTASFRVPAVIGQQVTLSVPPISTILGLLSAAKGSWVLPQDVSWLAYCFEYESADWDVEFIVQVRRESPEGIPSIPLPPKRHTIIKRQFLLYPRLTLYLPPEWANILRKPRYSLLLGRTQDVATVEEIAFTRLEHVKEGETKGVILPIEVVMENEASAQLFNLPIAFQDEPVRNPIRMHIFGVVDAHRPTYLKNANGWLARDTHSGIIIPIYRKEWMVI